MQTPIKKQSILAGAIGSLILSGITGYISTLIENGFFVWLVAVSVLSLLTAIGLGITFVALSSGSSE